MKSTEKCLKFTVCVMILALLVSVPLAAHSKDKIIIGQAVSLTGPLGPSSSFVSAPYYDFWVKVLMALHNYAMIADKKVECLDLAIEWSRKDLAHFVNEEDVTKRWRSFDNTKVQDIVTYKTLFKI